MVAHNRPPFHPLNKRVLESANMGAAGSCALICVGDMPTIVPLRRCRNDGARAAGLNASLQHRPREPDLSVARVIWLGNP
jgi:hypothetical protein